ncbi:nucleolin-like [Ylistrum balloti]|uniref:nucleolin-like n=1 Tax=Ylistrum balloti TaxID=509963 RepID=UPI0029059B70|nr:nucleolin-like [Ylistrum balloti]XP_060076126.1 nucleolin-like [Ylistrum balloti]XP_060076127.1 nucleolin-like [Ylistrum balloti]
MAENTENMDTSENIGQDIDETIDELSELVKDDAVVGDKEETKEDENMDDSTDKKEEDSKEEEDSKAEEKDSTEEIAKKKRKKPNFIDKTQRPPLVRVVQGEVIINNFKMKDAKMKDFLTILSKADSFVFEYNTESTQSSQTEENKNQRIGKITLTYSAKKDFKALSVINILADLVDFDSGIEIIAPDSIKNEVDAELYGIRRHLLSQAKDKTLYVNDITNATTEEFLRALVPDCTKAHIPVDSEGNKLGWAVLEFRNGKEADECMKTVKEIELGTDNKVVISRAESTDPADLERAKELHKNKPPKRKKAPQTPAKDKKRQWNQGPGMLGPRPLIGSSPKGGNMGNSGRGWSQGGGAWAGGDMSGSGRQMNYDGGFGNRGNARGGTGKPRPHTAGSKGNYGKQGSFGGNQGYGNQGFGKQDFGNRGFGNQDYGYQGYERQGRYSEMHDNYGDGRGNMDDDNMLDFLQSAIMEMKNKKSAKMQSGGDRWGGGAYSQYEGFVDNPKRRRDNWSDPSDRNWGSGRNNQGSRGQQQGLGVWTQGGNQQNRNDMGRSGGKNYGGGYGGGQYDSYSSYGGRY